MDQTEIVKQLTGVLKEVLIGFSADMSIMFRKRVRDAIAAGEESTSK